MNLFKLMGTIAIDAAQAKTSLDETSKKASETAETVRKSSETVKGSNKASNSSWTSLRKSVSEYKAQGLSTSQAWAKASADMRTNTETSSSGIVSALKRVGAAVASAFAVQKVVSFGKSCVESAATVQAQTAQFSAAFGDLQSKASQVFQSIAQDTGVLATRLQTEGTKAFSQFKGAGLDAAEALEKTNTFTRLAADGAAYYDMSLEETSELMRSFIRGNTEAGDRIGLFTSETQRNQAALDKLGKKYAECTEAEKQMIMLDIASSIYESSGAMGQASREADGYENVVGNLKEAWKQFQAVVGSPILSAVVPVLQNLTSKLSDMGQKVRDVRAWMSEHQTAVKVLGVAFSTAAVAIAAFATGFQPLNAALSIGKVLVSGFGTTIAFLTSPITLAIAAIGAIAAAVVVCYNKFDGFREVVDNLKEKLVSGFNLMKDSAVQLAQQGIQILGDKLQSAKEFFGAVADKAQELWSNMQPLVSLIGDNLAAGFQSFSGPLQSLKESFGTIGDVIANHVWPALQDMLMPALEIIIPLIGSGLAAALGIAAGAINGILSAVSGLATAFSGIVQTITGVFQMVVGILTLNGDLCKQAVQNIKDGIVETFGGLWDAVSGFIQGFVDGVVGFFQGLWDTLVGHSIVPDTINGIINCFSGLWSGVSGFVSEFTAGVTEKFTSAKDAVIEKAGQLKDGAVEKFSSMKESAGMAMDALKTKVGTAASGARDAAGTAFSTLKTKVSGAATGARDAAGNAFSSLKSKVTSAASGAASGVNTNFNRLKSSVTSASSKAKSSATSAFSAIKSGITSASGAAYSSVASKFGSIGTKISSVMNSAKNAVANGISSMRSKFNFTWSLPKLKLPHFSISGSFSLNPPSVPHFGVSWYKKAMENAMILNAPTIFGYSAASGKYLGGGESGQEVVAGSGTLMSMIREAVAAEYSNVEQLLQQIIDILVKFLPELLESEMVLDDGTLVAKITPKIDKALGQRYKTQNRGRA